MTSNPTIVICPGAWPVRSFFEPLQSALSALSHPTIISITDYSNIDTLLSTPSNPDATSLRQTLQTLIETSEREVVLLMHSYGGVYGPSSISGLSFRERQSKGLKGGVVALIFFTSFNAKKGESAMDVQGFSLSEGKTPDWAHYEPDTGLVELTKAKEMLYHNMPDDEAQRLAGVLPKMPIVCFVSKLEYDPFGDEWYNGAFGYVFCGGDRMLPLEAQKMYAERAGVTRSRELKESSHSPHLEQPKELAEAVVAVLEDIIEDLRRK
ncbi:uncharacterized protein BDR25DRAFT_386094 [Lindgomyces ingoldianus]|uniref:Uncharacterized protein n=1 Tax=Lindgomyces ingoldianus TaxID=673940 RepID=A0ACB6Q7G3_9PLEO|nr:uncharacterized protein BDR25DRAFT_386094 [Lindgomyces ingoldianus]KAF2462853.1 hypothetical protein BDR25DRAFT_386094 [Lindgomyces ingoldianus]